MQKMSRVHGDYECQSLAVFTGLLSRDFNDYNPPHFHAKYSGYEARFNFDGDVLEAELPRRATKFVQEWISLHKFALEENWNRAQNGQSLNYIAPLE